MMTVHGGCQSQDQIRVRAALWWLGRYLQLDAGDLPAQTLQDDGVTDLEALLLAEGCGLVLVATTGFKKRELAAGGKT